MHQTYGTPYYIAPEILAGEYNEKCDIWSCGVILYILLCGRPPFDGENDDQILENVAKGLYKISGPIWSKVSTEGIDLVRKMLQFDPEKRISAQLALSHQWIVTNTESILLNEVIHSEALKNLKEFNASTKLQQAALTFLTTHLINKEEMNQLQMAFQALDKNNDGKLSKQELLDGFIETMGQTAAEIEAERIMKTVDIDKNGCIDYSEFISATIDKRKLLSKERLKAAFALFDRVSLAICLIDDFVHLG
jgi:calcium-dependent protein kinase